MDFLKCPKCGRYMIPYIVTTDRTHYRCICGYDTAKNKIIFRRWIFD